MKVGEYSIRVAGGPPMMRKCLRWEKRQIVSDEELAAYKQMMSTYPEMVSEDYEPYEEFCAEYSETEYVPGIYPIPEWMKKLERYDTPLLESAE